MRRDSSIGTEVPTSKLRHDASCRLASGSARGPVSRSPRCCHRGCVHCTRLPAPTRPPTSRLGRPLLPPPSTLSVGYADNLESFPARSPDVQRRMELPPSTHDQECPASPALPEATALTLPSEPDFREPDRHERAPGASSADARCLLGVGSEPHGGGAPSKLPEENLDGSATRSKRCETNVGHRGGFQRRDGVATISTDQHAYQEMTENRTPHVIDSIGPKPNFAESARRPAGRRRVAEPTETSQLQTGHDRNPVPICAQPRGDVTTTTFRLTCAE